MTTMNFLFKIEDLIYKIWREENNKSNKDYPEEDEAYEFLERKLKEDKPKKDG